MSMINPYKSSYNLVATPDNDVSQTMQKSFNDFLEKIKVKQNDFDEEKAFKELINYVKIYEKVLYSSISNLIYSAYDNKQEDYIGSIMSNFEKLLSYTDNSQNIATLKKAGKTDEEKYIDNAKIAVIKIWDHINLANQQYKVLKQSDSEYKDKFNSLIRDYKEEMNKEMSSQLITLVSIFTALAFLVFGSINTLDNIFSIHGLPLTKVICVGCIWALCLFNLIFIFLYCVSKITNLNFRTVSNPNSSIFRQYSLVWWTNLIIVSILAISSWFYLLHISTLLIDLTKNMYFVSIGSIIIIISILCAFYFLYKFTVSENK